MVLLLGQYGDICIFATRTGQYPPVTQKYWNQVCISLATFAFLKVPVKLFWIMMTPIFQGRLYDKSTVCMIPQLFWWILTTQVPYERPSLKYTPKLSWNLGSFSFNVPRARQCTLKTMFIKNHRFEICGKYLQMDG